MTIRDAMPLFPVMVDLEGAPGPTKIPWEVAERAYAAYAVRFGRGQSIERIAQRGGFYWSEMDAFYPRWRQTTAEWFAKQAEMDRLRGLGAASSTSPCSRCTFLHSEVDLAYDQRKRALEESARLRGEVELLRKEVGALKAEAAPILVPAIMAVQTRILEEIVLQCSNCAATLAAADTTLGTGLIPGTWICPACGYHTLVVEAG